MVQPGHRRYLRNASTFDSFLRQHVNTQQSQIEHNHHVRNCIVFNVGMGMEGSTMAYYIGL